ncbi:hypothetical protein BDV96DRAFT_203509 [Lophiotrema nucula]|uniref:Uncharacterized protein n=1 Tax=Lophiotrema nucula TaxID=690887 RepID=A0A6A5ZPC8_9PLEO|nr:hypothetical protein BDV96DRAFT_203509 [Lophiotrema nucula]
MAPPWVVFDNAAVYRGHCSNGAEPDIAGVGVVISFVLASIITTTASILAMILDQAFDSKGQLSFRAPVKSIRERFLDTEWKKDYAWRPFLDPLIIGLGDQQLFTGYAVLLSGWIKVAQRSFTASGAHFVLILYICALSSSSHLAALITLRKYFGKYKLIAKIRMTLVVAFAVFLFTSMIATIAMPQRNYSRKPDIVDRQQNRARLCLLVPMFFMFIGFSIALVCILTHPHRPGTESHFSSKSMGLLMRHVTNPKQLMHNPANTGRSIVYYLFLNPLIAFCIQILLAVLSLILVLSQKFSLPADSKHWCSLNSAEANLWGFGQTLSVVLLLLPAMAACQTYLEGRENIQGTQ